MTDTVVAEGQIKFRDGKKWKTRWVLLRKPSPVADCLSLLVYKEKRRNKEKGKSRKERLNLTLEGLCGVEPGQGYDGVAYTLSIVCLGHSTMLGFHSREALLAWDARIRYSLGEVHRFSVSVQPGNKLESGPASLHLCNNLLVLIRDVPPTVIGHWKLSELRRYGAVPNGFVFEGGTRCGCWAGVFFLSCLEGEQISLLFDCIVRGISPSRGPHGLRPALPVGPSTNPSASEERIALEALELEKRLSMLSFCSRASGAASTYSCSTVAGDDHISISSSSSSQSETSYGSRLPVWAEPTCGAHFSTETVSSSSAVKDLASSEDCLYAAVRRPPSTQFQSRCLHDSGRHSSFDSGIGIVAGSQSSSSGSFSSYTCSLDSASQAGGEEFSSLFSLPVPPSSPPLPPPPPPPPPQLVAVPPNTSVGPLLNPCLSRPDCTNNSFRPMSTASIPGSSSYIPGSSSSIPGSSASIPGSSASIPGSSSSRPGSSSYIPGSSSSRPRSSASIPGSSSSRPGSSASIPGSSSSRPGSSASIPGPNSSIPGPNSSIPGSSASIPGSSSSRPGSSASIPGSSSSRPGSSASIPGSSSSRPGSSASIPGSSSSRPGSSASRPGSSASSRHSEEYHIPSVLKMRYDIPRSLFQRLSLRDPPTRVGPPELGQASRSAGGGGQGQGLCQSTTEPLGGGHAPKLRSHSWGSVRAPPVESAKRCPARLLLPAGCPVCREPQCSHVPHNYITPEQWRSVGCRATPQVTNSSPFGLSPAADPLDSRHACEQSILPKRGELRLVEDRTSFLSPDESPSCAALAAMLHRHNNVNYVNLPMSPDGASRELLYMELDLRQPRAAAVSSPASTVSVTQPVEDSIRYAHLDIAAMETAQKVGAEHAQGRKNRLPQLESWPRGPTN